MSALARLWPCHLFHGVVGCLILGILLRSDAAFVISLALFPLISLAWVVLFTRRSRHRRRQAEAYELPRGQRIYLRVTAVLSAFAWVASLAFALLVSVLYLAFRPHSEETEVFETSGLGVIRNFTRIEPEFGDGGLRRNVYTWLPVNGGEPEEIGSHTGDGGRFSVATNTAFVSGDDGLEFVVGDYTARRVLTDGGPRWRGWRIGEARELPLLRLHFPPYETIERSFAGQETWAYPSPWLTGGTILALDSAEKHLRARARFGLVELDLFYSRPGFDAPWTLELDRVRADNPHPARPRFPDGVAAELTVVQVEPGLDLLHPGPAYDDLDRLPEREGLRRVSTERHVLAPGPEGGTVFRVDIQSTDAASWQLDFHVVGAWRGEEGTLVAFVTERRRDFSLLRGQPPGRAVRVQHFASPELSQLIYLRLSLVD